MIAFLIPFWGDEPHRRQSHEYLTSVLMESFGDLDPPAWGFGRRSGDPTERSIARNALAARALEEDAEILVFIDADSIPDPAALLDSINNVMLTKRWAFPYTEYYALTEEGSKLFMEEPPWKVWHSPDSYEHEFVFPGPNPFDRPEATGGCVIVHRDAWEQVGGYDERFRGWGGEDRAFAMALETLVHPGFRYPAPIYHLWHPTPVNERFGQPDWKYNQELLERYRAANHLPQIMGGLVKGF